VGTHALTFAGYEKKNGLGTLDLGKKPGGGNVFRKSKDKPGFVL